MNLNYKEKFIKYKQKYLELKNKLNTSKGGLVGVIPIDKLSLSKKDSEIPIQIIEYIDLITIPNTKVIRVGSGSLKIQPYFSDIDVMNIISLDKSTDDVIRFFIDNLKKLLENLKNHQSVFFSDFKTGGLHWSVKQILEENNNGLDLKEGCKIKDVIKMDLIAPFDGRYVEMSTFYILQGKNGYINVDDDYFKHFERSLKKDIIHYINSKPFKAIKRTWSLVRLQNDLDKMNDLKDLINSNVALLGQINADFETIVLLLEHGNNYDLDFVIKELNLFKQKISNILDIKFDEDKIDLLIDFIINQFTTKQNYISIIENINKLSNYLLEIINRETLEYLRKINFTYPIEFNEIFDLLKDEKTKESIIDVI